MSNLTLPQRFARWSTYLNILVVLLAVTVLAGWLFDIDFLKRPLHIKAMNPVSAVCFGCFGFAFWMFVSSGANRFTLLIAQVLIAVVVITGLIKLFMIAGGPDLQIDSLIFRDSMYNDT